MANPAESAATAASRQGADESARLKRAYKTLSAGNRILLRASHEDELLQQMCQVIVDAGGYRLAAVGFAVADANKRIHWAAYVGPITDSFDTYTFTWADTECGQSASAVVIRTGEPVVGREILTDPAYSGAAYALLREDAIKKGYLSTAAFPLRIDGDVVGALSMAAEEAHAFDAEEVALLSELADDLAYGIKNLRAQEHHRQAQATIARLAYYDGLTGLPNRTRLLEQLKASIRRAKRENQALAILHIEVGRYDEINKILGYRAGDALLRKIGQRLTTALQGHEVLARVGDAEFALLLPDCGAEQATDMARRLYQALCEPVKVRTLQLDARAFIGIALFPGHATQADTLIRRANAAMHQNQPAHGGYAMYTSGQEQESVRRIALMADLRRAIRNNELSLHYQPKIAMSSRRVCGAEVLVRWQHPGHGLVSTQEFIMLVEQAGMVTPLTTWVLEAAFRQSHAWRDSGLEQPLAINLSAHDLYDSSLVDRIAGLISTWGIAPELIQFELTESALMADPVGAVETLTRLKRLNVDLFVDDFGTGYSSLSYLQKLPVDGLKIDQSFVTPMAASGDSATIVKSTIELGHNLGLKVVAEGVESEVVWERLVALGCDIAQGYLISRPMPAQQFKAWEHAWS
ncbi:putative bifunctional diguanylate cyclase/phosphodiesterase [Massilia niastensis]|uniref:putative bifunctional diguanylate cyclase/phosphodiesterase n=1 Tax=Massilia niastensis TaxID=544911 RepID=UPI00037BBC3D|nr:GGDEF domain-containing protein [Massilia niastensis]